MTLPRSLRTSSAPRALLVAAATLMLLATAACGGEDTTAPPSSPAPTGASGSSDAGGASSSATTTSGSSASPTPTAIPASPPPKSFSVKNPCSGEGTYDVRVGAKTSRPSVDPREDTTLDIGLASVRHGKARLTASLDGGERRPVEPVEVGSTISVDLWTLTVTSVCRDSVRFDVID